MNITFQGNPLTVEGTQLQVGDKAPDFSSVKTDLNSWSLSEVDGVKIISVVPSLDTGVCQIQTRKFSTEAKNLGGASVITISLDLPFAQARWAGEEGIDNMTIVSDYQNREFALKYGLLIKELKLLSRAVLVLDKDNTVKYVEYLKEITDEPDYSKAVAAAKALM
ncbi:thiol peroxidase, atypical 2-Cys peroxiredoxin [Brevinema andersonii]|uniref:Thiol peroxidase, atypical 2-Cys peroxiredoxin n=1 Tax=Brevinema andersonii TaxID=34097 RepID=A0A1I1DYZ3_BREAD|nr:thiol peroxidase [Brevinema andersonii]SFB77950.1 thiol peroxidase, atypical 2-Cys peroxiredoxin [Brevinema andersonii]